MTNAEQNRKTSLVAEELSLVLCFYREETAGFIQPPLSVLQKPGPIVVSTCNSPINFSLDIGLHNEKPSMGTDHLVSKSKELFLQRFLQRLRKHEPSLIKTQIAGFSYSPSKLNSEMESFFLTKQRGEDITNPFNYTHVSNHEHRPRSKCLCSLKKAGWI